MSRWHDWPAPAAARPKISISPRTKQNRKTSGRGGTTAGKVNQAMRAKFAAAILSLSILPIAHGITLDAVLNKTLENNPEIQRAKANLEAATGRRLVLRSIAWPNLRLNLPAGVQGGYRAGSTDTKLFGFVRGSLAQPLINAAIPPSFRRGDVEVLIAEQQLNLAVEQQLHTARLAYYSAAYNRELLSVREKQRRRLEENVASQSERYQAGIVDRSAFTTATVEARELDPLVEGARRSYADAQLQLS